MKLTYKTDREVSADIGTITCLSGLSSKEIAEFSSAIEKAITSNPLDSCDVWDSTNSKITKIDKISESVLTLNLGRYGYSEKEVYRGKSVIHGVRYIGLDNFSSFTSVTESPVVQSIMLGTFQKADTLQRRMRLEAEQLADKMRMSNDARSFLTDLVDELTLGVSVLTKVVILPKPVILSAEQYAELVSWVEAKFRITLLVVEEVPEMGSFLASNANKLVYVRNL